MKLFKYIWRNASRNRLRSALTILSVGFGLAIMTVLYGYLAMQGVWEQEASQHNRIVVLNVQGFAGEFFFYFCRRAGSEPQCELLRLGRQRIRRDDDTYSTRTRNAHPFIHRPELGEWLFPRNAQRAPACPQPERRRTAPSGVRSPRRCRRGRGRCAS